MSSSYPDRSGRQTQAAKARVTQERLCGETLLRAGRMRKSTTLDTFALR